LGLRRSQTTSFLVTHRLGGADSLPIRKDTDLGKDKNKEF